MSLLHVAVVARSCRWPVWSRSGEASLAGAVAVRRRRSSGSGERAGGEAIQVGSRARRGPAINAVEILGEVIASGASDMHGSVFPVFRFFFLKRDEIWSVSCPTNRQGSSGLAMAFPQTTDTKRLPKIYVLV